MNELLEQLPPAILMYVVLIPVLIILLMVYLAVIRPWLAKRKEQKTEVDVASRLGETPSMPAVPPSPKPAPVIQAKAAVSSLDDDMPDLDLFLNQVVNQAIIPPQPPVKPPTGPRQLGQADVVLVTGQTINAREELILLRDPADGRLIVQMAGATYKSFTSAPAAKDSFSRLMNELAKSLAQPETATPPLAAAFMPPTPPVAPVAPPVESAPTPPPPANTPAPIIPPMSAAAAKFEEDEAREPLPGDLPRYSNMRGAELKGRGFLGRPKYEFERIPDLNIGESIEAYLKHRLSQTPGYERKAWHVHPALNGGVRIEVDGLFFDSVSDITDVTARTFIQTAIQEWQERQ